VFGLASTQNAPASSDFSPKNGSSYETFGRAPEEPELKPRKSPTKQALYVYTTIEKLLRGISKIALEAGGHLDRLG
jgi:hypothetical protein